MRCAEASAHSSGRCRRCLALPTSVGEKRSPERIRSPARAVTSGDSRRADTTRNGGSGLIRHLTQHAVRVHRRRSHPGGESQSQAAQQGRWGLDRGNVEEAVELGPRHSYLLVAGCARRLYWVIRFVHIRDAPGCTAPAAMRQHRCPRLPRRGLLQDDCVHLSAAYCRWWHRTEARADSSIAPAPSTSSRICRAS